MPLTDTYPRGTVFVGRKMDTALGTLEVAVEGTGFLARFDGAGPLHWHTYVVTAAHVVEGAARAFVRVSTWHLPTGEPEVHDIDVPEWFFHSDPTKDVAVAPISLAREQHMVATGITQFIDDPSWESHKRGPWQPELGDDVYFVGLLAKIEAMTMGNIPIVRSGTLGRMWQERCPVVTPVDTIRHITAHLIDCRSFGGFSGSPCYLQQGRAAVLPMEGGGSGVNTEYRTTLLGMIGGHYDDWIELRHARGASELKTPMNTGVGYVIPAEFIRETLMQEELVEMREKENDRHRKRVRPEEGATMDSAPSSKEESEYERFEDLTKKLVQVPKPELDAERKKDEGSN